MGVDVAGVGDLDGYVRCWWRGVISSGGGRELAFVGVVCGGVICGWGAWWWACRGVAGLGCSAEYSSTSVKDLVYDVGRWVAYSGDPGVHGRGVAVWTSLMVGGALWFRW